MGRVDAIERALAAAAARHGQLRGLDLPAHARELRSHARGRRSVPQVRRRDGSPAQAGPRRRRLSRHRTGAGRRRPGGAQRHPRRHRRGDRGGESPALSAPGADAPRAALRERLPRPDAARRPAFVRGLRRLRRGIESPALPLPANAPGLPRDARRLSRRLGRVHRRDRRELHDRLADGADDDPRHGHRVARLSPLAIRRAACGPSGRRAPDLRPGQQVRAVHGVDLRHGRRLRRAHRLPDPAHPRNGPLGGRGARPHLGGGLHALPCPAADPAHADASGARGARRPLPAARHRAAPLDLPLPLDPRVLRPGALGGRSRGDLRHPGRGRPDAHPHQCRRVHRPRLSALSRHPAAEAPDPGPVDHGGLDPGRARQHLGARRALGPRPLPALARSRSRGARRRRADDDPAPDPLPRR